MNEREVKDVVEAALLAAGRPLTVEEIREKTEAPGTVAGGIKVAA